MPPDETLPADDRTNDLSATPTLYLPAGVDNGGFLFIPVRDALGRPDTLSVKLIPHLARTVYALYDAMQEDSQILPEARGWRRPEKLARLIERHSGWPIAKQTVLGYLTNLQKCVQEAARRRDGPAIEVPVVIERERSFGARFYSTELNIIDGDELGSQPLPRPR
jgi:hypothetical protein